MAMPGMSVPGASALGLGYGGDSLLDQTAGETEEQRKKRLLAQQQQRLLPGSTPGASSLMGQAGYGSILPA